MVAAAIVAGKTTASSVQDSVAASPALSEKVIPNLERISGSSVAGGGADDCFCTKGEARSSEPSD